MANAAWNTFGTVCTIAVSFLTAPILIRHLGADDYGILLLVGSVVGLLGVMNFGMGEATLRFVARHFANNDMAGVNRVFGSTLTFYVAVGSVVSLALFGAAPMVSGWLNISGHRKEVVSELLRIASLVFAVGIVTSAYAVIPSSLERYDISSKIGIVVNAVRTGGYIALAIAGFGLVQLVSWDLALGVAVLLTRLFVARHLMPSLRLFPSFSFAGMRETVGYSIFVFLTWAVHTAHRESGKMLLGRFAGAAPVAYLGTPDSIAQRLHLVIASGSEALIPRFSANRDAASDEALFWNSTWSALAMALIIFVPFFILVPDFLRLWISPEFARESGWAGRWLALYLISQSAFAPVAAYFRGIGKPWFVTVVISGALLITLVSGLYLVPSRGVEGAAIAYFAGSMAPFLGVIVGGTFAFGFRSASIMSRIVVLPLFAALVAGFASSWVRSLFAEVDWVGLVAVGGISVSACTVLVVGSDWLLGGLDSPSRRFIERVISSRRFKAVAKLIPARITG